MYKLVLIRHGESVWNKENRFTGWVDVDLTEKGVGEAHLAAKKLEENGFTFDIAFTSVLKRAYRTLDLILEYMGEKNIEIHKSWKLNERFYGALQGLNKSETAAKYGEEQVQIWRRGYDVPIPPITKESEMYPGKDPLYADLNESEIPLFENLKMVVERVVPYWESDIAPQIKNNKSVIVAASGNSLRALLKHIENMPEEEIVKFEFPTGIPLVCELDEQLKLVKRYFLADEEELKTAIEAVISQGKTQKTITNVVRGRGLEPPWIAPLAPKASASANFATRAFIKLLNRVRPAGIEPATVCLRGNCSTN